MTEALQGRRFWKHGNHTHVWVVDAIISDKEGHPPFAVLVSEDGRSSEDVDLSHLENTDLYTPVS
jgi:hypothetical protein